MKEFFRQDNCYKVYPKGYILLHKVYPSSSRKISNFLSYNLRYINYYRMTSIGRFKNILGNSML